MVCTHNNCEKLWFAFVTCRTISAELFFILSLWSFSYFSLTNTTTNHQSSSQIRSLSLFFVSEQRKFIFLQTEKLEPNPSTQQGEFKTNIQEKFPVIRFKLASRLICIFPTEFRWKISNIAQSQLSNRSTDPWEECVTVCVFICLVWGQLSTRAVCGNGGGSVE